MLDLFETKHTWKSTKSLKQGQESWAIPFALRSPPYALCPTFRSYKITAFLGHYPQHRVIILLGYTGGPACRCAYTLVRITAFLGCYAQRRVIILLGYTGRATCRCDYALVPSYANYHWPSTLAFGTKPLGRAIWPKPIRCTMSNSKSYSSKHQLFRAT